MQIRVRKYYFFFIAIVWLQLAPSYIVSFINENRFVYLFFLVLAFTLAAYFVSGSLKRMRPMLFFFSLPFVLSVFSTIQNNGDVYQTVIALIKVVLNCFLVDVISRDSLKIHVFLCAVRDISLVYFVLNIAVIIFIPQGFDPSSTRGFAFYLYGNPNAMLRYILPGLCCSSLIDVRNDKKMSGVTICFLAGLLFTYATTYFSATSVVGVLIILIWILLKDFIRPRIGRTRLAYYSVLAVTFLFEINIVLSVKNADISRTLDNLAGKTDAGGIASRRVLWMRAASLFLRKPFSGWGMMDSDTLRRVIGNASGAHNYYLDIAYQRGLIGLGLFACVILYSVYRINKVKSISETGYILMGYCCACFAMFLVEPYIAVEPIIMPIFYMFVLIDLKDREYTNA